MGEGGLFMKAMSKRMLLGCIGVVLIFSLAMVACIANWNKGIIAPVGKTLKLENGGAGVAIKF